jgi:hypothetical protein
MYSLDLVGGRRNKKSSEQPETPAKDYTPITKAVEAQPKTEIPSMLEKVVGLKGNDPTVNPGIDKEEFIIDKNVLKIQCGNIDMDEIRLRLNNLKSGLMVRINDEVLFGCGLSLRLKDPSNYSMLGYSRHTIKKFIEKELNGESENFKVTIDKTSQSSRQDDEYGQSNENVGTIVIMRKDLAEAHERLVKAEKERKREEENDFMIRRANKRGNKR